MPDSTENTKDTETPKKSAATPEAGKEKAPAAKASKTSKASATKKAASAKKTTTTSAKSTTAKKSTAKTASKTTRKTTAAKKSSAKSEAEPAAKPTTSKAKQQKYFHGTGRRKKAIATVKLFDTPGEQKLTLNDKPLETVLPETAWQQDALKPLVVTSTQDRVSIEARSYGGGLHGQAAALSLGIARALTAMSEEYRPILRQHSLLTRDARARESKKYGLKRARKAPQYTKR